MHQNNIIMGDLNGKTSTDIDYIQESNDKHSPVNDIEDYAFDIPIKRNNSDNSPIDTQGRKILNMCQTLSLRILNGRTRGDRWGNPTRFPLRANEKPSALDYAICSTSCMNSITSLYILPFIDLSDHCCISLTISTLREQQEAPSLEKPPISIPRFDIEQMEIYQENLSNDDRFSRLTATLDDTVTYTQDNVDAWTGEFSQLIIENARTSFKTKPSTRSSAKKTQANKSTKPAKWYNNDCLKAKNQLRRTLNKLNKNPYNPHLQELYLSNRKDYKRACRKAEGTLRNNMTEQLLAENDPKTFWKLVKNMQEYGRQKDDPW